ncbi:MAG: glutamate--tRNA ligase, partial [Patescibacteria group bacterium]
MSNIRVRIAPSPTGFLHIGNLRTALFDYVIAKHYGGKMIIRIEDTDQKREVPGAVESLLRVFDWIGIKFDEGPEIGGPFAPYIQTQRLDIYKKHAEELLEKGGAYPCFCSPERLDQMRRDQQSRKEPPHYDRHCRELSKDEAAKKIASGEKFVLRQKMPLDGKTVVHDELRGDIGFNNSELEDHVLIKSDGIPTYQFASVVDDHLMEISHVLRGEEWIPSFPKNILLYQAFGWIAPKFIHMALTLNKGGGKLSKRQGDVAVEDYKAKGYLPEALINFSILQGWHPKGDEEILTLAQIIEKFRIEDMGTSPAIFDIEKLDYFNGYYIRHKSLDEIYKLCLPYLEENLKKTSNPKKKSKSFIKAVISLEQERLKKLSEIGELTEFLFVDKPEYDPELLVWKKMTIDQVKQNLQEIIEVLGRIPEDNWTNDSIEDAVKSHIQAKNGSMGEYLWPMRVALTGRKASPPPFDVAEVL